MPHNPRMNDSPHRAPAGDKPTILFVAPFFGRNTSKTLACFARLPDINLGILTQEREARIPPELRRGAAAVAPVQDAQDPKALVEAARRIERKLGRIDRIEAHLEQLQEPVAAARTALSLPGIDANAAHNFRNKNRMKEVLRAAGVPVARQALVHDAEDAHRFIDEVGYPIVLKPVDGQGADDTRRAYDDLSLSTALNALLPSRTRPAQAEEFVIGAEHTCETVMIDGRSVWSSSVRYLPNPLQVIENPWMQYCLLLPREQDEPHLRAFRSTNEAALRALGMRDGLSHMEWFRRPDGSAVVSEVGARPPGANIMTMISAAHDTDTLRLLAELAAYKRWDIPERRFAVGCVFLRAMGGAPTIRRVTGAETLQARLDAQVVEASLPVTGRPRSDHYEGDGYVLLRHPSTRGVLRGMRQVLRTVKVL